MRYVIGVDIGTTSLCALVAEADSYNVIEVKSCKNDTLIASDNPACFEQDAVKIIEKVIGLLGELVAETKIDKSLISSIAITGQMHGVVLLDDRLDPVTPFYTWRDRRAEDCGWLETLSSQLPETYSMRTGCKLSAGFGGLSLSWLLNTAADKEKYAGCKAVSIMDYLALKFTGRFCTDYSNAAGWGIFDIVDNAWYADMLKVMGIPQEMLPEIVCSGEVLGTLKSDIAEKIRLSDEVKVYVPIGDNQASYYGAGKGKKGVTVVNVGTSGQITVPSDSICLDNGLETRPLPNAGYILVGAILCGGWAYDYLASFFIDVINKVGGIDVDKDQVFDRMKSLLQETYASKGAGIAVDTRFSGTRSGIGEQTGSISGIDEGNLKAGNLIYGFLYGIILELADMLPPEYLEGDNIKELVATGNAIRLNPAMLDIITDIFSKSCVLSQVKEEAAAGAAFVAINNGC